MSLWLMHLALPVQIWLPFGLALLAPLFIVAVALPISRRRLQGIATVLALRTVGLLALGFVILAALATFAVVHTGLRELSARHLRDVDALAESLGQDPLGLGAGDARLRMELFRATDADIAIVAASSDACSSSCLLVAGNGSFDQATLREPLAEAWPALAGQGMITIHHRPYLLIANSGRNGAPSRRATVVAAIDAGYLADQAAHTAWLLVAISYVLLIVVGWSSWQQVRHSLAARIHAINTQLLSGNVEESHETFDVGGHELRELANSVSAYIKRTLEEKSSSDERYRRLVELAPDAVLMCADTRIRSANPAAIALAGASDRAEVIASTIDRFLRFEDKLDAARSGGVRLATWTQLDGTTLHVEVAEIADSIGGELVRQFVVRDITHSRRREADLAHRAEHDSLTGLVNRARFESRLREILAPGGIGKVRGSSDVAVLFIDLDDFKPVNDTYGHAAGDAVLVAVAGRLSDSTRGTDLVARLGGDEFAVLLEVRDSAEADAVAERILRALHLPISYDGKNLSIRASVGIANTRPASCSIAAADFERPMTASELLKAADAAMYAAKSAGGDRFVSDACGSQSPAPRPDVSFPAMA